MQRERVTIGKLSFQTYRWGTAGKPKLVFLHGWMDTGASFHFLATRLTDHADCVAIDLRGFGQTQHTASESGYFFYDYLLDLHRFLERESPNAPVALVGHSMGGNVATLFAGAFPERVSHVISLEGLGPKGLEDAKAPQRVRAWIEEVGSEPPPFRVYDGFGAIAERLKRANPHLSAEEIQIILPQISKETSAGFHFSADPRHKWTHPYLIPLSQYFAFWSQIRAKSLVVLAGNTNLTAWLETNREPKEEISYRLSHFPKGTRVETLAEASHMMHHEKPDELAALIIRHLGS